MSNQKTKKLVGTAFLAAIIVVLQTVASGIKIGPFTPTLSLIPIVVGAIIYGEWAGAFLGLVFGIVVFISVLGGAEPMSTMMFELHPFLTAVVCLLKGALAGFIPGIAYKLIKNKDSLVATAIPALLAPITNTGIFTVFTLTVFLPVANTFAEMLGFKNAGAFVLGAIIGTNFIGELLINAILTPIIARVIKAVRKG